MNMKRFLTIRSYVSGEDNKKTLEHEICYDLVLELIAAIEEFIELHPGPGEYLVNPPEIASSED